MPDDTIYAVSSGRLPAAIAVMRISGERAGNALLRLAGRVPPPRVATLQTLRAAPGDILDRALTLWFPGPASATGEDVAELHLHGSIAVVDAVSRALTVQGLRLAEPGEFTRRAVLNGRLDLNEAEGLADLLAAETEIQRREAVLRTTGSLGRQLDGWTDRLLALAAQIEREIDYDDEDRDWAADISIAEPLRVLQTEIAAALQWPEAERLRDGVRVAIVGPVNAGKSSLFNALLGHDAAIVSSVEGTTRDIIERPIALRGLPVVLMDTAGFRDTDDPVERIGIDRARRMAAKADLVLDLAAPAEADSRHIAIAAKADLAGVPKVGCHAVSALTGAGLEALVETIVARATALLPTVGALTLNKRQRAGLEIVDAALLQAIAEADPLFVAERLMAARRAIDLLTGRAGVEDLLDTLFSRFCLGK